MNWTLKKHSTFAGVEGPVIFVVLDGIGIGKGDESDAVSLAYTPTLDWLRKVGTGTELKAHGTSVGLPSDGDMGNSEVGHNALGCGRVFEQGALLVNNSLESGALFNGATWQEIEKRCISRKSALHFLGLLSDGNVHSNQEHLHKMLSQAANAGIKKLYVHVLLDGRDVPTHSSLDYLEKLEAHLASLRTGGVDAAIASGGGRMHITMDRYEADWAMVERGWKTHVLGDGRRFPSAANAVETYRQELDNIDDQNLPPFVIAREGKPVAPIVDGDAVVCFNFRGDRAIEISRAFEEESFSEFQRGAKPDVLYSGMMEYDGDTHVPKKYLVEPPAIEETMGQYLSENGVPQLAISETQKYGHVTYFWNGNKSGAFDPKIETYVEIPSDLVPFEQRPWMKAAEITDSIEKQVREGKHKFVRVNYANGDMVGHTGSLQATVVAVEAVDLQLARLSKLVESTGGALIVTADHGNADEMFQHGKDGNVLTDPQTGEPIVKTSHTLNLVPFVIYDPRRGDSYKVQGGPSAGLANAASTALELLGFHAPQEYQPSLLLFK